MANILMALVVYTMMLTVAGLISGTFIWFLSGLVAYAFDIPEINFGFGQSWVLGICLTFLMGFFRGNAQKGS
jgi:hypothetical protein